MPNFSVSLTDELIDAVDSLAMRKGISMASLVRQCVVSHLIENGCPLSDEAVTPVRPGRRRVKPAPEQPAQTEGAD